MASTEFESRSHKGTGLLFFLGFAFLATGLGFTFAPKFSWQVTQIARQANALGLENGLLILSGFLFFGMGLVARASGGTPQVTDHRAEIESLQSEFHIHNEQFSTKLAQVRTTLLQVNEALAQISAQQQAQTQSSHGGPEIGGDHSQDAIFRLAASLDKLHAHLDERVHAVDLQLRSGFETLLHASHDVRRLLEQGPRALAHAQAPSPAATGFHHASGAHPQAGAPEAGIDFFETMQKLDAIAGPEGRSGQPQPPFPSQGQQSLDALLPEEYRDRY